MGAPMKDMNAADESSAEALLTSLRTIDPAERRRHASVFNYWLSIRGKRQFPAIRDLDPLEISDAGPCSVLMEMIGGGEDAEIRHLGHAIKGEVEVERISDAPKPSLLSCIHAKLPIVASSRQAYAFEDEFATEAGTTRCWVTLLPLSASGTWIDFVYAFVSLEGAAAAEEETAAKAEIAEVEQAALEATGQESDPFEVELRPYDEPEAPQAAREPAPVAVEPEPEPEPEPEVAAEVFEPEPEPVAMAEPEPDPDAPAPTKTGFSSKLLDGLASVGGFYGKVTHAYPPDEPEVVNAPADEALAEHLHVAEQSTAQHQPEPEQPEQSPATTHAAAPREGSLQDKLSDVRGLAEQARQAQEQSNLALYQGLGAAYDFALDAEDQPEDYLRLVEAQGLKIQLRSPMQPVVKLAFAGLTDDDTIRQLEAVLAWALKNDLPRGSLAERIQGEGGIGRILAA